MNRQKYRNSRLWDRIKNHPELTQVSEGKALNFLLNRLSTTALAYDWVHKGEKSDEMAALRLTRDQLHHLNLRQLVRGGSPLVFRADGGSDLDLEWWPYLLRRDEFESYRNAFERERDAVLSGMESSADLDMAALTRLETTLGALTREFYRQFAPEKLEGASYGEFVQYRTAETFLRRLDAVVVRLQDTGSLESLRAHADRAGKLEGEDLLSLLTYMTRNGLEFAPAQPGDEQVYHTVYAMMRDLYVAVADEDDSVQPVRASEK
jgi:hypothetical protein